jgi:predicted Fe-Mo cluster-binding NifX family protein
MKIAIPVKEKSLDSFPDDRFARGKYFLIYDPDSGEQEFIDLSIEATHGAGPVAVSFLAGKGVDTIIAFHLGQNALQAIEAAGMAFFEAREGAARENIERVLSHRNNKR